MTGIKGRSGGKATTLDEKAQKAKATAAREEKRNAKRPETPHGSDPTSDDPVVRLGRPVTWSDELKRQQVVGERIQNRRREVEVQRAEVELARAQDEHALARGDLRTREQFRESVAAIVAAMVEASSSLTLAAISSHPPERQPAARHQFESALAAWRTSAMALIKDTK